MKIVCIADCGVDRYLDAGIDRAGGIGLNVAVHAQRLCAAGDTVTVIAPVGDDDGAVLVRSAIESAGLASCLVVRDGATPVQQIRHAPDGERLFVSYDEGVLAGYRVGEPELALIARADVVITTAFGQGLDLFESVLAAPTRGIRAVDFTNLNDVGDPLAFVDRHAADLEIGLFGLRVEDGELIDGLEEIASRAGRLFVVTLGPTGALALGGRSRVTCPAVPVEQVVDTTGAGDAFTAGVLCSYAARGGVAASLARGVEVATATLGHLGSFELQ